MKLLWFNIVFLLVTMNVFPQQPIGKTKNSFVNANNVWEITSVDGKDGSKSGSLFIENFPYVNLDKNKSYWVAGYAQMDKPATYQENSVGFNSIVCNGYYANVHPNDPELNLVAQSSIFFQLFHGDLAGLQRDGADDAPARYRIFFNTHGVGDIWHRNESERLKDYILEGDYIKFVMGFVRHGDVIDDPNIPIPYRSGSYIYYQITDSLGNLKKNGVPEPPGLCYNSYDSTKNDQTYRIYMGSDSHGNIQDWEASVRDWLAGLPSGDTHCDQKPSGMNPLLGKIFRMIFIQDVLSINDVESFFSNPINFSPPQGLKLDFPKIIEDNGGYSLEISNSHWRDYTEAPGENGDISSTYFTHLPDVGGPRNGLITTYTDSLSPTDYGIVYNMKDRHELNDRKFKTVSFLIGNDKIKNTSPEFYFYVYAKIISTSNPADTSFIYFQFSPLIQTIEWDYPYLKIPAVPVGGGNEYFNKYVFKLEEILQQNFNLIGYDKLVTTEHIIFRGVFNLADLVFSEPESSTVNIGPAQNNLKKFWLSNNYPNPFNPRTTIRYQLPEQGFVTIKVYGILGNEITTLVNEFKPSGSYKVDWNANDYPSGVYFYQLRTGSFFQTKKMILLK